MRIITCFLLYMYFVGSAFALNGIKHKRASAGLVFTKSSLSKSVCSQLSCGSGSGYLGTSNNQCFSVVRCNGCGVLKHSSIFTFCSVITSLAAEITLFQGSFQLLYDGSGAIGKQIDDINAASELSGMGNGSESDLDITEEAEDDEDDYQDSKNSSRNSSQRIESDSSGSFGSNGSDGSHSLLQLFSQMEESETEIDQGNEEKSSVKQRKKGFMNKIFHRKKKNIQAEEVSQVATLKKGSKVSFAVSKLFNKFRLGNKGELNGSEDVNGRTVNISSKPEKIKVRKGSIVRLKLNGKEMKEKCSRCQD